MTNVREDMEKMRNLYTVGGSVIEAATMKNNLENPQKKKKWNYHLWLFIWRIWKH